jgi:hypothetical protein
VEGGGRVLLKVVGAQLGAEEVQFLLLEVPVQWHI